MNDGAFHCKYFHELHSSAVKRFYDYQLSIVGTTFDSALIIVGSSKKIWNLEWCHLWSRLWSAWRETWYWILERVAKKKKNALRVSDSVVWYVLLGLRNASCCRPNNFVECGSHHADCDVFAPVRSVDESEGTYLQERRGSNKRWENNPDVTEEGKVTFDRKEETLLSKMGMKIRGSRLVWPPWEENWRTMNLEKLDFWWNERL